MGLLLARYLRALVRGVSPVPRLSLHEIVLGSKVNNDQPATNPFALYLPASLNCFFQDFLAAYTLASLEGYPNTQRLKNLMTVKLVLAFVFSSRLQNHVDPLIPKSGGLPLYRQLRTMHRVSLCFRHG